MRKTIEQTATNASITAIEKPGEADEWPLYAVGLLKNKKPRAFYVATNGVLESYEVTVDEMPEPAKKLLRAQVTGSRPEYVGKVDSDGSTHYLVEATMMLAKQRYRIAADGSWWTIRMAMPQIPEPVRKTALEKAGQDHVFEVQKVFRGSEVFYKFEGTPGDAFPPLFVSKDGQLLAGNPIKPAPASAPQ